MPVVFYFVSQSATIFLVLTKDVGMQKTKKKKKKIQKNRQNIIDAYALLNKQQPKRRCKKKRSEAQCGECAYVCRGVDLGYTLQKKNCYFFSSTGWDRA